MATKKASPKSSSKSIKGAPKVPAAGAAKKTPLRTIVMNDMKTLGIGSKSFTYKAMLALVKLGKKSDTPITAMHKVAESLDSSVGTTAAAFSGISNKIASGKFGYSFTWLKNKSSSVTKEDIISGILEMKK